MIISDLIEIEKFSPLNSEKIEGILAGKGITPVRWAIVNVGDKTLTVSVAYDKMGL